MVRHQRGELRRSHDTDAGHFRAGAPDKISRALYSWRSGVQSGFPERTYIKQAGTVKVHRLAFYGMGAGQFVR